MSKSSKKSNTSTKKSNIVEFIPNDKFITQKELKKNKAAVFIDVTEFTSKHGMNKYFETLKNIWDFIFDDPYENKEKGAVIKCFAKDNKHTKYYYMKMNELLMNLIFWRPNIYFSIPINEEFLYNMRNFSKDLLNSTLNYICKKFIDILGSAKNNLSKAISFVIDDLVKLSESYSVVIGSTISLRDLMHFKNRNANFNKLINTKLDESKPFKEIELEMKEKTKELLKTINADKKNCLYPYLSSSRLKASQTAQLLVAVGTRPDMDKTVLPTIIKQGFLRGLSSPSEFYVEAVACRDALLTKLNSVPSSGYLSRRVNILCSGTDIDYSVEDCGTKHYLEIPIKDEFYLNAFVGKYMLDESSGKLVVINKDMKHLIGKTIKIRSHVSCKLSRNGTSDRVCKTCVGEANRQMYGTRLGALVTIKFINLISQKAISSKHMTGTNAVEITNESINKFFDIDGNTLYIKEEYEGKKSFYVVVPREEIEDILYEDIDFDKESINTTFPLKSFEIIDDELEYVVENEGISFSLTENIVTNLSKIYKEHSGNYNKILIPGSKISSSFPIFNMIVDSEEVSRYLRSIIKLLDSPITRSYTNYSKIVEDILDIVEQADMKVKSIHIETILHNMIRDIDDITRYPDFSKDDVKYTLLNISNAILQKDIYTSLIFEDLRNQFKDIKSFLKQDQDFFKIFFNISKYY